jgi:hypothetical protein
LELCIGDFCISPVYMYKNTFSRKLRMLEEHEEILGVQSFCLLGPDADDDGEGRWPFMCPVLLACYFLSSIIGLTPFYFHMRRVGPWMLTNKLSELIGNVLCMNAVRHLHCAMALDISHI